jgi:hypothetical protein
MTIPDPIDTLDKPLQSAVRIAISKARWTHRAADSRLGAYRIHAYPLVRTPGSIAWGVVTDGHECIATDVDTLKKDVRP